MIRKWPFITAAAAVAIIGGALLLFTPVFGFTQVRASSDAAVSTAAAGTLVSAGDTTTALAPANAGTLAAMQYSFREVSKKVLPVVVEINVTQTITQDVPQFQLPFPFPFGDQGQGQGQGNGGKRTFRQQGLGSGIIVQKSGERYYVLTNNHVVKDASDISVRLSDQRTFKAKVVGTDPRKDVALVSFDSRQPLPVAELGDSNGLQVGDLVLAVGNPFGFESTVTMGIVSALGRHAQGEAATYTDYIQTDAAINQGNSGGALVNIQGQVVGINTWIAAPTGGSIGLGFAIPINNARPAINDFITKGKVTYGWLGAQIADIQQGTPYRGFAGDLKVKGVPGALLLDLFKGSPADKAGLLPGDYVTRIDGTDITNADRLTQVVGNLPAGKRYEFSVIRYGEKVTVPVTLGVRDDKDTVAQDKNLWPGMTVLDIDDQVRQEANIPAGLKGVAVGYLAGQDTAASIAGLHAGDVITHVNGKRVDNILDFYRALNEKKTVSFSIVRDGTDISIGLTK
jgi:Do/DeqQ family serine protease